MPAILLNVGRIAVTWIGRLGIAAFGINEINKLYDEHKGYIDNSTNEARKAGMDDAEYQKIVAATTYDTVEQNGGNPEDFWAGLSPAEKEALRFSPTSLQSDIGRTKFLGLSSALLFVGALVAGGVAGVRGIPILLSTLGKLRGARAAGATALELMTIIEEGKILGIAKVWVPGLIAGIASAGGWLTSGMTNNLNDATLWGRIFLGQAAEDFEKAQKATPTKVAGSATNLTAEQQPRTIIRMVEEKQPEQFIGTLFSAKLGDARSFERHIDTEITDEADLLEDVKLNLTRWLQSLPGRLGYSIIIRKDPVDEWGVKQSGTWATLTLHTTRLSGPIQPIDTILLGPVSPMTRLKLSKTLTTVEAQIPGLISGQQVREIQIPSGTVDIFDATGARVDMGSVKNAEQTVAQAAAATQKTIYEPTAAQMAARLNPTAVSVRYPLDGIYRAHDGYGAELYKRYQNVIYAVDLPEALIGANRAQYGNSGGQAAEAVRRMASQYGIDYQALPGFNLADLQTDATLNRSAGRTYTNWAQWYAIGVNTPANVRMATLNA